MITTSEYDCGLCPKRSETACNACQKTGVQINKTKYITGHCYGFPYQVALLHPETGQIARYGFECTINNPLTERNIKTIYISQPREGRSWQDFELEADRIKDELDEKYGKYNTYYSSPRLTEHTGLKLIEFGNAIQGLIGSNCAYFASGWEKDKSCRIEHDICEAYGIEILKD